MCFKISQHNMTSVWCKYSQYRTTDYMESINFWTNTSGTFSTIVFCFVIFLLFPFPAFCTYWCFFYHSLHPKNCTLLLFVIPRQIWRKEKITQITDMISSLPSDILPCSQLGFRYIIYTAIHIAVLHYGKIKRRNMDEIISSKLLSLIEPALMIMHAI